MINIGCENFFLREKISITLLFKKNIDLSNYTNFFLKSLIKELSVHKLLFNLLAAMYCLKTYLLKAFKFIMLAIILSWFKLNRGPKFLAIFHPAPFLLLHTCPFMIKVCVPPSLSNISSRKFFSTGFNNFLEYDLQG